MNLTKETRDGDYCLEKGVDIHAAIQKLAAFERKKMYTIRHCYDIPGDFGDAIMVEDIVGVTSCKELAEAYKGKWNNPHVYDDPYDELECGRLEIGEIDVLSLDKQPEGYDW